MYEDITDIVKRIKPMGNPVISSMVKTDMRLWLLYGIVPPYLTEEDLNR